MNIFLAQSDDGQIVSIEQCPGESIEMWIGKKRTENNPGFVKKTDRVLVHQDETFREIIVASNSISNALSIAEHWSTNDEG